ncbi:MAG: type II secretion system protein [Candidatus Saccharibacteria bacterium]|nr:type II secretion system protein [Candidatus Saccharibacteria bacterium]
MSKQKSGFTIIETMLFIAITGLVFAGVVIGTNGSLRSQRYRDTVQSFISSIRDVYSRAENTQIANYSGKTQCGWYDGGYSDANSSSNRGRSNCAVYGVSAAIYTHGEDSAVFSSLLGGMDETKVKENYETKKNADPSHAGSLYSDYDYLVYAGVNDFFMNSGASSWSRRDIVEAKLLWGAKVHALCSDEIRDVNEMLCDGKATADGLGVEMIVYRSPNTGSMESFARYTSNDNILDSIRNSSAPEGSLVKFNDASNPVPEELRTFKHRDVSFCVEPGDGMSSSGGMRMVTIDGDGTGENAVRLIEADSEENKCNK